MNIEDLEDGVNVFFKQLRNDKKGRDHFWEHCYTAFYNARSSDKVDFDYLSLLLYAYLASWGMLRNSFIMNKDHTIYVELIKVILDEKYDLLQGIECKELKKPENTRLFKELYVYIGDFYKEIRSGVRKDKIKSVVSETLITKVMLGTLGCIPAFDRYFKAGIHSFNIHCGAKNSIPKLTDFYINIFSRVLKNDKYIIEGTDIEYPQMKLLDMGLWQVGLQIRGAVK